MDSQESRFKKVVLKQQEQGASRGTYRPCTLNQLHSQRYPCIPGLLGRNQQPAHPHSGSPREGDPNDGGREPRRREQEQIQQRGRQQRLR